MASAGSAGHEQKGAAKQRKARKRVFANGAGELGVDTRTYGQRPQRDGAYAESRWHGVRKVNNQ